MNQNYQKLKEDKQERRTPQNEIFDYNEPELQDVTGTDHEIDESHGSEINYEITPQNDHSDLEAEASFVPIVSNTDPDLDGA